MLAVGCGGFTRPVIDTGPKPITVDGTIAGHVVTAGNSPVVGREITATQVETGKKYQTSTSDIGSYTLKVPPGKYRLSVELKPGESIAKGPHDTDVNASDVDAQRDFTLTAP